MGKIQKKWRDSIINIDDIKFKDIKLDKIVSYPPAGNDVFECIGQYKNKKIEFVLKSERGKFANFFNEIKVLDKVKDKFPVPLVLEEGKINELVYFVMTKLDGDKLSDIFKENKNIDKKTYLYLYGQTLAKIHNLKLKWEQAKMRDINDYPNTDFYTNLDEWEAEIISYLKETKPKEIKYDTFIHGDFHYGNILWENKKISGILDWEYSGMGFKEQDIAWAIILRPGQQFMDKDDVKEFLRGYNSINKYDSEKLKWCLCNGMMHFYLMNKKNNKPDYLKELKNRINDLIKEY